MKKFWIWCFAALCIAPAGCAGDNVPVPEPAPPQAEVPEIIPEDAAPADPFAGMWLDSVTAQCRMEIRRGDGDGYAILISQNDRSGKAAVWQLEGTYDEIWEGIAYAGAKYEETAGERKPVPEREEITGLLYFEDGGSLHWVDDFDHTGDDMSFEKE